MQSSFKVGKLQKKVISVFGKLYVPVPLHLHFWKNEDFFIILGKNTQIWGKFKIWRITFFKVFYHLKFGMVFRFFAQ